MQNKEQAMQGDLLAYISDGTPQSIIDRYAQLSEYAISVSSTGISLSLTRKPRVFRLIMMN